MVVKWVSQACLKFHASLWTCYPSTIPSVGWPESPWPWTASPCLVGEIVSCHRKGWSCFICDFSFVIALKRWTCYNSSLFNAVVSLDPYCMSMERKQGWRRGEGTFASPGAMPWGHLPCLWMCRGPLFLLCMLWDLLDQPAGLTH